MAKKKAPAAGLQAENSDTAPETASDIAINAEGGEAQTQTPAENAGIEEVIAVKPEDSDEDLPIREEDLLKEDEIREQVSKRIKQFRRKGGKRQDNVDALELRKSIEALLFASGRPMLPDELAMLIRVRSIDYVKEQLAELKKDYEARESPIMVTEDNLVGWKLVTHEKYLPIVARINPNTELSKTLMETMAVVAWKQPILQSEVIRVRTNKAYEHIAQLEEMGFLTKEKHGRSQLLRLTQKFFDYFDLQGRKDLQQLFGEVKEEAKKEGAEAELGKEKEQQTTLPEHKPENKAEGSTGAAPADATVEQNAQAQEEDHKKDESESASEKQPEPVQGSDKDIKTSDPQEEAEENSTEEESSSEEENKEEKEKQE
jgi:segregation and condensation protein B